MRVRVVGCALNNFSAERMVKGILLKHLKLPSGDFLPNFSFKKKSLIKRNTKEFFISKFEKANYQIVV
jgi:hypothetical protein